MLRGLLEEARRRGCAVFGIFRTPFTQHHHRASGEVLRDLHLNSLITVSQTSGVCVGAV